MTFMDDAYWHDEPTRKEPPMKLEVTQAVEHAADRLARRMGGRFVRHAAPEPSGDDVERVAGAIHEAGSSVGWDDTILRGKAMRQARAALSAIRPDGEVTTNPGPGAWVPAEQFVELRAEVERLREALRQAEEALTDEPKGLRIQRAGRVIRAALASKDEV